MMVLTVMFSMAYLILASTQNVWMFYIGRCLTGFSSGVTTIATPTYISEVASPKIRGMLGSAFQVLCTNIVLILQNIQFIQFTFS